MFDFTGPVTITMPVSELMLKLDNLQQSFNKLRNNIMATLEELKAAVAENVSVGQSVVTLIDGLVAKIQEQIDTAVELQALKDGLQGVVDDVTADTTLLANKVSENTPNPEPPVE